ncbi:class I SAM-dependent methyltransferase [Streptomyces aurantiacus]|uniref:class I SAM-dependent methyltransferase n=1 Tax=Streptomyces aurantiacus TaxID=47760 RepID=UPI0006E3C604|nr:class I SAM-dependent methyltransferase [Streptomyces aurantiacus]
MTLHPDDLAAHYERLADDFEESWAHSPAFVTWMNRCIGTRLALRPGDRAADIGCGSGLYARSMAEYAVTVVCVDPSTKMLAKLPTRPSLVPVRASIEDLAEGAVQLPHAGRLDAVLAKDVIHHARDVPMALRTLAALLAPGGRLVIVTWPLRIDYPLFGKAVEQHERAYIDPDDMARVLTDCGLRVEVTCERYHLSIAKEQWLAWVANRFMSLLCAFDDDELAEGLSEIDARYPGPVIGFEGRFVFTCASGQEDVSRG